MSPSIKVLTTFYKRKSLEASKPFCFVTKEGGGNNKIEEQKIF